VVLYLAIGLVVLIGWPLPLLHGRRPYTLTGLAIALPLQIPQAVIVGTQRGTNYAGYTTGLLLCRAGTGIALGFVHINLISTLLDLFGSSLQSDNPHGELVVLDDVRRHGGGMGLWLGFWSWCWIGSIAIGFLIGAEIINGMNISWGFYISTILIAIMLLLTVITPETRRRQHRRTMQEVELPNDTISRRVARGEIKMHVSGDGPKWWWEEVFAGLYLSFRMLSQSGFLVMTIYVAWIYAEIVLIIVLLGNLLSADYRFRSVYVGLGVFGIAVGAWLAIPSSKANILSKSRSRGPRTDSMTFQPRFSLTSHFIRRTIFMTALPVAGLAYTFASKGKSVQYMVPIIFAALIGYISNLAISECNGIIMETFDTSDLQPGANSRHRLQSLAPNIKRKRTSYSSYPRVSAGLFITQAFGYMLAAASTGIGGAVTRRVGAQRATAITAGILLLLTLLLTCALVRYKIVQVIPDALFGEYYGSSDANKPGNAAVRKPSDASEVSARSWRAVVIGNPSGKARRMNWMELGSLSRWTEVRRLNRMLNRSTTQGLNAGWS
jgi:MFS family permease